MVHSFSLESKDARYPMAGRADPAIKEATMRYHYDSHEQLRRHLDDFVNAYNFGRRLRITSYKAASLGPISLTEDEVSTYTESR